MPPKSKSIFRQPGAQHFQLVHRSQRDPLINDPEASTHILKPFERVNVKGKSRAELESTLAPEDKAGASKKIGEASLYGIYYDDTEYDYMQHLRPVGMQEDGVDSILIEAPSSNQASKSRQKNRQGFELSDLPDGVLASTSELPRTYESQQAIPESIAGFQPNMDAHLRQVLEALEDDAFVDDGLEDDFFAELVADGERDSGEEVAFDFREGGVDEQEDLEEMDDDSWQNRFAKFKKLQKSSASDDEFQSEDGDTVGTLPAIYVIGGKKRRKGGSDATGYTMSSGSMYRNDALQTLDARFDQMILKEYNETDENPPSDEDDHNEDDEAPELITSREDFDSMINTFLNDFEILGRKLKPKLEGESGPDKLENLRQAMGQDGRVRLSLLEGDDVDTDDLFSSDDGDKKETWDCETILSTFSNLENHPRLIRAKASRPVPKIVLDKKTGLPSVASSNSEPKNRSKSGSRVHFKAESESDETEEESHVARKTVARPRNETKEEKLARKSAAKAERHLRREEKKTRKEQFSAELKSQKRALNSKELKMKKL